MIGGGAWGTAVAKMIAENGHDVFLWCLEEQVITSIRETHMNERYLPGILLPNNLVPVASLQDCCEGADYIFEAVPVAFLRSVCKQVQEHVSSASPFVVLSKGIEQETMALPSMIIDDIFGHQSAAAVVAGPSFAQEVATHHVTGLVIAGHSNTIIKDLRSILDNDYCRTYPSSDILGVQCGGALKNIIALGVGILDGAGYGYNTKALFFTRGFNEMVTIAHKLGAQPNTLYGLSGLGDLVLTATGSLSRNAQLGQGLGRGESRMAVCEKLGTVPEGVNTIKTVQQFIDKHNLDAPLCRALHAVVEQHITCKEFIQTIR